MANNHKNGRSTKAEVEARVEAVAELLIRGFRRRQILQYAAGDINADPPRESWDVSERQVDTYIERATALLSEAAKTVFKVEFGKSVRRHEYLFSRALAAGEFNTAISVERSRKALLGLDAPRRTEHTGKGGGPIQTEEVSLTDEERAARIMEILAKVKKRVDGS